MRNYSKIFEGINFSDLDDSSDDNILANTYISNKFIILQIEQFLCNTTEEEGLMIYSNNDNSNKKELFTNTTKFENGILTLGNYKSNTNNLDICFNNIKLLDKFINLCKQLNNIKKIYNHISISPGWETVQEWQLKNNTPFSLTDIDIDYFEMRFININIIKNCHFDTLFITLCNFVNPRKVKLHSQKIAFRENTNYKSFNIIEYCDQFVFKTGQVNYTDKIIEFPQMPDTWSLKGLPNTISKMTISFGDNILHHKSFSFKGCPTTLERLTVYLNRNNLGYFPKTGFSFKYVPTDIKYLNIEAYDMDQGYYYQNIQTWGKTNNINADEIKLLQKHKIYYIQYSGNPKKRQKLIDERNGLYELYDFNQKIKGISSI